MLNVLVELFGLLGLDDALDLSLLCDLLASGILHIELLLLRALQEVSLFIAEKLSLLRTLKLPLLTEELHVLLRLKEDFQMFISHP